MGTENNIRFKTSGVGVTIAARITIPRDCVARVSEQKTRRGDSQQREEEDQNG